MVITHPGTVEASLKYMKLVSKAGLGRRVSCNRNLEPPNTANLLFKEKLFSLMTMKFLKYTFKVLFLLSLIPIT